MPHTKFQDHRSIDSGEEDFEKVFSIYGHGGHVGHVTQLIYIHFHFHLPSSFHVNFDSKFAGRPKAALLFWFFGDFRCGALLFMVIHVIYKYKNK